MDCCLHLFASGSAADLGSAEAGKLHRMRSLVDMTHCWRVVTWLQGQANLTGSLLASQRVISGAYSPDTTPYAGKTGTLQKRRRPYQ